LQQQDSVKDFGVTMGNLKAFYLFLFFSKSTAGGKLNENTQKLFILTEKY
jgi:hypothetical protein